MWVWVHAFLMDFVNLVNDIKKVAFGVKSGGIDTGDRISLMIFWREVAFGLPLRDLR